MLGFAHATTPSPVPEDSQPERQRVAMVSRDGGRTWDTRALPDTAPTKDGQSGFGPDTLITADGKTVYSAQELDGTVRIQVSIDGARTWHARALIDLDGPLLSLLPVGDGTVLVQGPHGTYRSTDQARTFTRVGSALGSYGQPLPGGGFAIPTNTDEVGVWLSPDGAAWTYVHRPDVP